MVALVTVVWGCLWCLVDPTSNFLLFLPRISGFVLACPSTMDPPLSRPIEGTLSGSAGAETCVQRRLKPCSSVLLMQGAGCELPRPLSVGVIHNPLCMPGVVIFILNKIKKISFSPETAKNQKIDPLLKEAFGVFASKVGTPTAGSYFCVLGPYDIGFNTKYFTVFVRPSLTAFRHFYLANNSESAVQYSSSRLF